MPPPIAPATEALATDWFDDSISASEIRLAARVGSTAYEALCEVVLTAGQMDSFRTLMASSDFFVEQVGRQSAYLCHALAEGTLLATREWTTEQWDAAFAILNAPDATESDCLAALRTFRHRHLVRMLWREAAQLATVEDTFAELSGLADCCVRAAVAFSVAALRPKYGLPMGQESGDEQSLVVLAMGKLGGNELNLSSDIDLIFAYPEAGETTGGRQRLANQSYFIRLGQMVIRLLDAVTEDGFVFRVDMRLRPYGDSGALVGSFNALELYYQEQGREWERYAMVKARPITGTAAAKTSLMSMLSAFVYRRYTDFSVIAALRNMKSMMRAEVARLGIDADVKRGSGGIREIEFIAQSLQLIHGGRMPALRLPSLLPTLQALTQAEVLPTQEAQCLADHYRLLRRVEHGLQGMADRQTQALPAEPLHRAKLAVLVGYSSWEALESDLAGARHEVDALFTDLIADPADHPSNELASSRTRFSALNAETLTALGYRQPEFTWETVGSLLDSPWVASLQGEGRHRFEAFLPLLCEMAAHEANPDAALTRALPFVRAVCRRSAYLVLLQENPAALKHLLSLVAASTWVADRLAARPELLDELLHEAQLFSAPSRDEIKSLVRQQLLRIPEEDLEAQMGALSRIKEGVILRVAASELSGTLPVMQVSDNLTFLAEVMIEQAIAVARAELVQRYGEPQAEHAGFAVMAYGKLGGIELSYGSDLDLVFVFNGADGETAGPKVIDNSRFYTRLAQRVTHVLSAQMFSGRLYEVDLRLRPDGDSGLVAATLTGFRRYQLESAWTWEHQALVRSRTVAGDPALRASLEQLRREVLTLPRQVPALSAAVRDMRHKMRAEQASMTRGNERFDIKRDQGGIVDIEFVVQYLVLAHAAEHPALAQWSDVIRLLETLEQVGVLTADQASVLSSRYLTYRSALHGLALQGADTQVEAAPHVTGREQVKRVTEALLPGLQAT